MPDLPSYTDQTSAAATASAPWLSPVRQWFSRTFDFLYPPGCPLCQIEVTGDQTRQNAGFCATCCEELSGTSLPSCPHCGATVGPHLGNQPKCPLCRDEHYKFSHVIRLGIYQNQLQLACVLAKGPHQGTNLGAALGQLTWNLNEERFRNEPIDGVVPIPRHWLRSLTRSHNTAETLATVWGACLRAPVLTSILKKTRRTPLQTALTPTQRRENLKGAFAASVPSEWRGATLLLADDVMTTGATVQEATKQLLAGGVGRVVVAVVARGIGQRGFTGTTPQLPR